MTPPSHAELVGREAELSAVRTALAGAGAVVLIEGGAGIGKSRLVQEYLTTLPATERTQTLVAACPPLPTPDTLGAIIDAVRPDGGERASALSALGGALHPLFPEWADDLPPPLPTPEDAAAARQRVYRALAELLGLMDIRTLVVEDLHWADDATVEFLVYLAARPTVETSMVLTVRPGDLPADTLVRRLARFATGASGARLQLAPLDVPTTARLIETMLDGQPVSKEFATFLHHATDGLPLAIEETMRLLTDRADVLQRDGSWLRRHLDEIPLPPTVRDIVLERRDRLPPAARTALDAAAVLGEPADTALIATVAEQDPDAIRDGVIAAVRSGLLVADDRGTVTYGHGLTARAVYEAIPGPSRQQMHARAGAALADDSHARRSPGPLARHFREAGDTARWVSYAEQAADLALRTGDEATAITLLHDLCVHADLPATDVERLIGKFPFAALGSRRVWRDLVDVLERLLARGGLDGHTEALIHHRLGIVLLAMYETAAGRVHLELAAPKLGHEPLLAARTMLMLGWPVARSGTAAQHAAWLRAAGDAATSLPEADRAALAVDRVTGMLMLGDPAGWTEAEELLSGAGRALPAALLIRGNFNVADQAAVWGHYAAARERLDRAAELASREDYVRLLGLIRVNHSHLDWFIGEWSGLGERAAELLADEDSAPGTRLEVAVIAGQHAIATGDADRGRDLLAEVIARWETYGALQNYPEAAAALATLHLDARDAPAALELTTDAADVVVGKGLWILATELAPVHVAALLADGQVDAARGFTEELARGLARTPAPAARAALITSRALLGGVGEVVAGHVAGLWRAAADAWAALPRPYEAHRATANLASWLVRAGDLAGGAVAYGEAIVGLRSLGATLALAQVNGLAHAANVTLPSEPWRGGRRGYGGALSPREAEVVRLVAAGFTNREVAEALSRSPHTVGTQLRAAMRKLGVSSRTALAVKVLADAPDPGSESALGSRPGSGPGASAG